MLRGAGSIAIALPWLEAMGHDNLAHAAGTPAKRFLSVYQPGGTVLDKFWPSATDPTTSSILKPLAEHKAKLLVLKGLNMDCAVGEQHQAGIIGFLTGSQQTGSPKDYSAYPSIDQLIATRLQADPNTKKAHKSLQFAVRWATGKSHGLLSPINSANFEDSAKLTPLPPRLDPQQIFTDLFGTLTPNMGGGTSEADARIARRKSVLDYVDKRYVALSNRLGAADKAKLDNHLTKLREIESALKTGVVSTSTCKQPTKVDTKGYNPTTGLMSGNAGEIIDNASDAMIPTVGKFMMDMMVMAFACNLTNVGHFQWTDTEAKHTFPWLSLKEHHHYYQHDGGFKPAECHLVLGDARLPVGGHGRGRGSTRRQPVGRERGVLRLRAGSPPDSRKEERALHVGGRWRRLERRAHGRVRRQVAQQPVGLDHESIRRYADHRW
jgi:hypothetical protein